MQKDPYSMKSKDNFNTVQDGKKRKCMKLEAGEIPDDGFQWHKYGQKCILETDSIRSYYKCRFAASGCPAKKMVDRTKNAPSELSISYTSAHNHASTKHALRVPNLNQTYTLRLSEGQNFPHDRTQQSEPTQLLTSARKPSDVEAPHIARAASAPALRNADSLQPRDGAAVSACGSSSKFPLFGQGMPASTSSSSSSDEGSSMKTPVTQGSADVSHEENIRMEESPQSTTLPSNTFIDILEEYPQFYLWRNSTCNMDNPKGNISIMSFPYNRRLKDLESTSWGNCPLNFLGGMDTVQVKDLIDPEPDSW